MQSRPAACLARRIADPQRPLPDLGPQAAGFSAARRRIVSRGRADVLQGTLDLLILRTLALEPLHGWGISKRIRQLSGDVLEVNQGSLYPALYRLRDRGLIRSRWDISEDDRRVKVYELTAAGRAALAVERDRWRVFAGAMERVLGTA